MIRCPLCRTPEEFCFCKKVKSLPTKTYVSLIIHHREQHLSTNTGLLANRVLPNSQILYRGLKNDPLSPEQLIKEDFTPLFLFPDETSVVLTKDYLQGLKSKVHLIVPDGNWRQAKKFKRRIPGLSDVQSVTLPKGPPSQYYLRRQNRLENVCTFEAIARAMAIIEGESTENEMMKIFKIMVEQFLKSKTAYYSPWEPKKAPAECDASPM